jgi:cation diffusion facilitator family transporter
MGLKFLAYFQTGSVGLLSDAVESSANLVAAMTALFAVWFAARPVDRTHNYGHEKVEFFAGGIEGFLILIAAVAIALVSIERLRNPHELEGIGIGLIVAVIASAINFAVSRILVDAGRRYGSVALEADGRHLMTDVVTSAGVVIGLILVRITGVYWLDPVIALLIALNILWTGYSLIRGSVDGLMDRALSDDDVAAVRQAIETEIEPGETYHALRTRRAGSRDFVDFHLLVPGELTVLRAHEVTHRLEDAVKSALPRAEVTVHVEPIEDPTAWDAAEIAPFEEDAPESTQIQAFTHASAGAR